MKLASALLLLLLPGTSLLPQDQSKSHSVIEGIVTRDPDNQPVKKALIELIADNQSEVRNYTTTTGPDGVFRIDDIVPGRYHLFAERTGLLDLDKQQGRSDGRILSIAAGQELKDLHLRLEAAAVVRGRVTDEDGEPMQNAEVTVLRQTYYAGHKHWQQAGAERTNDLGEFRIANLPAGNVCISVTPPPDFRTLIENAGTSPESHNSKPDSPASTIYQTTYYPGTSDRSQATLIPLHAGDEFPANFTLTPGQSLSIRGSVVNMTPRTSATIMLQSRDFNVILSGAEMHKDGSFIIRDVSPGSYTIFASIEGSPVAMTARQSLQVGSSGVEGLRLAPQPGSTLQGHVRLEGRNGSARLVRERIFLTLAAADSEQDEGMFAGREIFSNTTGIAPDGSFQWTDVPAGTYYVQIVGEGESNQSWFIKAAMAGARDVKDSGIALNGGTVSLDLDLSAKGGVIEGVVSSRKGEPVANAVVVAVPESRLRSRIDYYRRTISDQTGRFTLRGIRPGDYTMFAWESVDGEAYCNPDFLKAYEGQGSGLHISEEDRKTLQLEVIPQPSELE